AVWTPIVWASYREGDEVIFGQRRLETLLLRSEGEPLEQRHSRQVPHYLMWVCLLIACIGTSWFAVQIILVPQPKGFMPNWHNARWVQASDSTSPMAYFRYEARFEVMPYSAFVTVTASQVFRLYVNGVYVGTNRTDFVSGDAPL